jgi:hypothetical protein
MSSTASRACCDDRPRSRHDFRAVNLGFLERRMQTSAIVGLLFATAILGCSHRTPAASAAPAPRTAATVSNPTPNPAPVASPPPHAAETVTNAAPIATDTLEALRQRAMATLLQRIAGRENAPAAKVFQNIRVLNTLPAKRFLEVMNDGFGHGLGVGCGFCHVPGQWASDARPNKNVARDMIEMVNRVNDELRVMPHLPNREQKIGCITCHQMAEKPTLMGSGG